MMWCMLAKGIEEREGEKECSFSPWVNAARRMMMVFKQEKGVAYCCTSGGGGRASSAI